MRCIWDAFEMHVRCMYVVHGFGYSGLIFGRSGFLDVRGSDIRTFGVFGRWGFRHSGFIFGRSGFSDVRGLDIGGSFSDVQGLDIGVHYRMFGV